MKMNPRNSCPCSLLNRILVIDMKQKGHKHKEIAELLDVTMDTITDWLFLFNGGGFDNHRIFWNNMSPSNKGEIGGSIADAINESFGNFADFKEKFSSSTTIIQGSGWGWLVYNPSNNKVEYKAMPNQTSPRTEGLEPLLGCDVWEHAYYLKYQNKRPDYVSAWWNVINWGNVDERYNAVKN